MFLVGPLCILLMDVNYSLDNYNENLRNELFEVEPNENYDKAYRRGETIFDKCEDDLKNITEILEKETEINEFFTKCKENKQNQRDENRRNDLL